MSRPGQPDSAGRPDPARRAGLAAERTALSWTRTAVGALAFGGLALKLGIDRDSPAEIAAGVAALVAGASVLLLRPGRERPRTYGQTVMACRLVTIGVVLVGVLAVIGALT